MAIVAPPSSTPPPQNNVPTAAAKPPASQIPKPPAPVMRDISQMAVMPNMAGNVPRLDDAIPKKGKYEVTDETDFTIHIYLRKRNGRWILMNNADSTTDNHSVVFRMWTYNEMVEMRKMATSYDLRKKMHEVDNDLLNRLKIQRLLKSWTFGDSNKNLQIQHVGGTMTDESWVAFTKLQPNIAQYIITEMNMVLEYNH